MFPQSSSLCLSWTSRVPETLDISSLDEPLCRIVSDTFNVSRETVQFVRRQVEGSEEISSSVFELVFTFPGGFMNISASHLVVSATGFTSPEQTEVPLLTVTFIDQILQLFRISEDSIGSERVFINDIASSVVYVSLGSPDNDMFLYLSSSFRNGQWFVNSVAPYSVQFGKPLTVSGFVSNTTLNPTAFSVLSLSEAFLFFPPSVDSSLTSSLFTTPSDGLHAIINSAAAHDAEPGHLASQHWNGARSVSFVDGSAVVGLQGDRLLKASFTCYGQQSSSSLLQSFIEKVSQQEIRFSECILIEIGTAEVETRNCDKELFVIKTVTLEGAGYKIRLKHVRYSEVSSWPDDNSTALLETNQISSVKRLGNTRQQNVINKSSSKQALTNFLNQMQKRPRNIGSTIIPEIEVIHIAASGDDYTVPDLPEVYQEEAAVLRRYIKHFRPDRAVMLINTQKIVEQWCRWKRNLPRVQPYYAVKCNGDLAILQTLANLGSNFDCASQGEIDVVTKTLQLSPDRIVYSNPCKQEYGIRHAKQRKVKLTVFDNIDELIKLARIYPDCELLLRISTDDSSSQCPLSCKFGVGPSSWVELLNRAKSLNLNIKGVHFHVGSGCSKLGVFTKALIDARRVFDLGLERGFNMNIINLGGGFPGVIRDSSASILEGIVTFEDLCSEIRPVLDALFPVSGGYTIVAEPGRYFAASSSSLAVKIYSRRQPIGRDCETGTGNFLYYINDGVYGSFNNLIFDHADVVPRILIHSSPSSMNGSIESAIFGQTCDGFDCIKRRIPLPLLEVGDWLMFEEMGAYTICAASTFNGFDLPTRLHVRIVQTKDSEASRPTPISLASNGLAARSSRTFSPCLVGFENYKQQQQFVHQNQLLRRPPPVQRPPIMVKNSGYPVQLVEKSSFSDVTTELDGFSSDFLTERSPQRPRVSFRPLSVKPLQSTAQQHTSYPRLGGGKFNPKLVASLLRTAYCRNRPVAPVLVSQPKQLHSDLVLPELPLINEPEIVLEEPNEMPVTIPATC